MSAVLSWETEREQPDRESDTALDVLRDVWSVTGQSEADLAEALGAQKSCSKMADVGFDGMADADGDLRSAWRATLERDGKLDRSAGSLRDLVLGSPDSPR